MGQEHATTVDDGFWGKLLTHILAGKDVPKFQVERAIGPILGLFITDILSAMRHNGESGQVVMLAAEFPILKKGTHQSTNVDWLMYDTRTANLIFVELKTERSSFSKAQYEIYKEKQKCNWHSLREEFEHIMDASKSSKYHAVNDILNAAQTNYKIGDGTPIQIVYVAPDEASPDFKQDTNTDWFSFKKIHEQVHGKGLGRNDSAYLDTLLERLLDLKAPEGDDNDTPNAEKNYIGRMSFNEVSQLCTGDRPILVGFDGGMKELQTLDGDRLKTRMYKWDHADSRDGKNPGNWIDGSEFLKKANEILARAIRTSEQADAQVSIIGKALKANPSLRLGQMLARACEGSEGLIEVSDDYLCDGLLKISASGDL